ncbi:hypothetical protein [Longimicrobium sp.]|jgi:hypothetical protein|uniref:hypothetical protein n=1 Tax=Longimicrobium sp. TaxID=2029185 RepID=UPI002ED95B43
MSMLHLGRRVAVCVLALSTTACAGAGGGLGTLGEILAGAAGAGGQQQGGQQGQGGVVTVEVQGVDQQRQVINVSTQQGQQGSIRYDQRTQVVYQQQQYPVTALERGDVVDMEIQQVSQNEYYVGRIQVRQSVQERNGQPAPGTSGQGGMGGTTTGQAQVFSGQVAQVDHQRNSLVIQIRQGVNATAYVPSNSPRATMDEFHRLRVGDFVRFEGRAVNNQQIEVLRFF